MSKNLLQIAAVWMFIWLVSQSFFFENVSFGSVQAVPGYICYTHTIWDKFAPNYSAPRIKHCSTKSHEVWTKK